MMNFVPARSTTLADVAAWAEKARQVDDRRALARVAVLWDNVPLAGRKLDVAAFEMRFPLNGFDPAQHKTEASYKAWRRKVISVLKAFVARTAPKPVNRPASPTTATASSDWDMLVSVIDDIVSPEKGPIPFPPQRAIPVKKLARLAKAHGIGPKGLAPENLVRMAAELTVGERDGMIRALRSLNIMRTIPEIAKMLPDADYPLDFLPRRGAIDALPEKTAKEIEAWLDASCAGRWDPVEQTQVDGTSSHDRERKSVALRRFCATAFRRDPRLCDLSLADLLTRDIIIVVLRDWLGETVKPLTQRSIMGYFQSIKVLAAHNGLDVTVFDDLERTTDVLRRGKADGKAMSPKVQRFCASLLDDASLQTRLFTLHVRARRLAQTILDRAEADGRALSWLEASRIRQLGAVAAFAAISTCGAPYRLERITRFRLSGPKADLLLPSKCTPTARFLLPEKQNPNKRTVAVELKQDHRNGLSTLMWYIEKVRPLFTEGHASEFLFPAVNSQQALRKTTLHMWFKRLSRQLGIPMTPHNMRHAIATMLIKKYPGNYEAVAVLLGDTEGTVRTFYAWVNKRLQIEAAQSLVLELGHAA